MHYRTEHDTMGEIEVPSDKYWGAQTERSFRNFKIGHDIMPVEIIRALAYIKKACAAANLNNGKLSPQKAGMISSAADEIISGELDSHFPLSVWQTGSGTQTNMNVNEVIANRGNKLNDKIILHPNDDVNMSQSSNDVFPSAIHIAAVISTEQRLFPAIDSLIHALSVLEEKNRGIIKIGRTHLEDATPIRFSDEISGWRAMLTESREMISASLTFLRKLAIGGTAVGTGLNAPRDFDKSVCAGLSEMLGTQFIPDTNKFHALTSKDALVFGHGALKALAANLFKIANDIRLLSSGPRCGIGEIVIPSNEPGSSIMPGKVNPTQCEAITMVALEVMGNDTAVGMAASQGNFELNVFMPLCAHNYIRSVGLLTDVINSFTKNCIVGIRADKEKINEYLSRSLMLVTALTPKLGYDRSASAAKFALENGLSLKEAVLSLGLMDEKEYDETVDPEKMV